MGFLSTVRDPVRYGFAVGRVRVLETRLLTRGTYERLLDTANFAEQRRVLSETSYGGLLEGTETAADVERALDEALTTLHRDFVDRSNLPEPIREFLLVQYDYANLKGLLKAELLGASVGDLTVPFGTMRVDVFREGGELPGELNSVATKARAVLEGMGPDAALVDAVVDAESYSALLRAAEESRSRPVRDLARLMVDVANVRVFFRARSRGLAALAAGELFVTGGRLAGLDLVAAYALRPEEAAQRLVMRPPLRGVDPVALADLERLDVVLEGLVTAHLRQAARFAVGPEPVLAYVMRRTSEIATLRMLLLGKLAGADPALMRPRLEAWV